MMMTTQSTNQLVLDLKNNNEDFEFYPTTDEMLAVIAPYLDHETVLDIGCGTCKFKKYMDRQEGERKIKKYYVMEKSRILLQQLDDDTICLGTDFNESILIDKKVSVIFCNPPYSEYENWTKKIISEGNYKRAFLIIPQRWKENQEIQCLLKRHSTNADVLGSFDFLHAERQARAKVDVVRLCKAKYSDRYSYHYDNQDDFDTDAFNIWFDEVFKTHSSKEDKYETDYDISRRSEERKKQKIKDQLVSADRSKASILVDLYNNEYKTLIDHLKKIMELDEDVLETFGFNVNKVKEGLKKQISGLKELYWKMVWNEFEEISPRLTSKSRDRIYNEFSELNTMDFTMENIWVLVLWVVKNANKYYNSQLIDFFRDLSDEENVRPYKSNQRLFENDGYSWNYHRSERKNYVLDYRIIMSSPFRTTWNGEFDCNEYSAMNTLRDIAVITKNLGFEALNLALATGFGEKTYIYLRKGTDLLMEYKVYKNGNMHVKFNKEFTKAMNVEVSRLLGWIRSKEDIKKEFPEEMAKGAEKYFKQNYTCIDCNRLLLTTTANNENNGE